MNMVMIQQRVLPDDWLQQVENFDVNQSSLSENNKTFINKLICYISSEKEASLGDILVQMAIKHIIFEVSIPNYYDDIPTELFNAGLSEIKNEKGLQFSAKVHSVFIEFMAYQKLIKEGFKINNIIRKQGACDLIMEKDNETYHIEVKFKESQDILQSRLLDYINGMSLFNENSFLRGNSYEININTKNIDDKIKKEIMSELKKFIENKKDVFKGNHITVFNVKKRWEVTTKINCISSELKCPKKIACLIQNIFLRDNGHISKLQAKAKKLKIFMAILSGIFLLIRK